MPISLRCPNGHGLSVAEKYAGRRVKCPKCQAPALVPGAVEVAGAKAVETVSANPHSAGSGNGVPKPPPLPRMTPPPARPPILETTRRVPPVVMTPPPAMAAEPPPPAIMPKTAGVQGYRPERSRVLTVYWLGLSMLLFVLFQMVPVMGHLNPASSPNWARAVLLLALLQLAFGSWMVSLPDWSTVRVSMVVLASVATTYCVALGMAMLTPATRSMALDLDDVRDKVLLWCTAVLLVACLLTYIAGRIGFRWRKVYLSGLLPPNPACR